MIKVLAFYTVFLITIVLGFPTIEKKVPEKVVAIVPANHDDLQPAQTFYSGYNNNYVPTVGVGTTVNGGFGWKGDVGYPNVVGSGLGIGVGVGGGYVGGYGGGYGAGYGGGYGAGYGAGYVPGYGPGYGNMEYGGYRVPPPVTGGYGWRQGPNRWALI